MKLFLGFGLNYAGTSAALRGCHNDVYNVWRLLQTKLDFDGAIIATDESWQPWYLVPTRANMQWLLQVVADWALPGDTIFLHYSGHGSYVVDRSGDEADGYDEVLVPLDYSTAGVITDDWLLRNFVARLPTGVALRVIIDACHSGSALDLRYQLSRPDGALRDVYAGVSGGSSAPAVRAEVVMLSGARDDQTAADAVEQQVQVRHVAKAAPALLRASSARMRAFHQEHKQAPVRAGRQPQGPGKRLAARSQQALGGAASIRDAPSRDGHLAPVVAAARRRSFRPLPVLAPEATAAKAKAAGPQPAGADPRAPPTERRAAYEAWTAAAQPRAVAPTLQINTLKQAQLARALQAQGAMTWSFLKAMTEASVGDLTWRALLRRMWGHLHARPSPYEQHPQLSASQAMNVDAPISW